MTRAAPKDHIQDGFSANPQKTQIFRALIKNEKILRIFVEIRSDKK